MCMLSNNNLAVINGQANIEAEYTFRITILSNCPERIQQQLYVLKRKDESSDAHVRVGGCPMYLLLDTHRSLMSGQNPPDKCPPLRTGAP